SHCVDFPHHREKRERHEERGEERCCQPCCQPCCCEAGGGGEEDEAEMHELKDEMRRLQNSVHRLASMVQKEDVHEKKEVTKEHKEHKEKRDRDDDDDREERRKEKGKRKRGSYRLTCPCLGGFSAETGRSARARG